VELQKIANTYVGDWDEHIMEEQHVSNTLIFALVGVTRVRVSFVASVVGRLDV
jgi:hypothetical protein